MAMGARPPQLDGDQIATELAVYGRAPFLEALVDLLEARPSPEAIKTLAEMRPDRWAQAVVMIARLAGYHDRRAVVENINILIHQMSDAQLLAELEKSEGELLDVIPKPALTASK